MGEIIPRWEWRTFAKNIELKLDLAKYEKTRHVESATVKADGQEIKTVAVEDPDPAKVRATVEKLGLWGRENINYVQALKRIRNKEL